MSSSGASGADEGPDQGFAYLADEYDDLLADLVDSEDERLRAFARLIQRRGEQG